MGVAKHGHRGSGRTCGHNGLVECQLRSQWDVTGRQAGQGRGM